MILETVYAPDSPDGSEGAVAILVRGAYPTDGPGFVTDDKQPLQVGVMSLAPGHKIPAHVHRPHVRTVERTQEVLFVRAGKMLLTLYTSRGDRITEVMLGSGDAVVLLGGGHALEVFGPDRAEIFEVKSGPYAGNREADKYELKEGR